MNIILCGYGKMGLIIKSMLLQQENAQIIGIVHPGLCASPMDIPDKPMKIPESADFPGCVVAGVPARVIKQKDEQTEKKTALVDTLRNL